MSSIHESVCPGCGLRMPKRDGLTTHAYYNASPECWSVYGEVLANEYSNAVLFGQVHRQTVDAYAAQHAGGEHPDKSIAVHLAGLHLVLERKIAPALLPAIFQRLATSVDAWPHFQPPQCGRTSTMRSRRSWRGMCDAALPREASGGWGHVPRPRLQA